MNDAASERAQTDPEPGSSNHRAADAPPPAAPTAEGVSNNDSDEGKRRAQKKQRGVFLDHLIRSLDIMVFCELSVLYYMDCSMLKFLVRAVPHWFYFTPKPDVFPPPPGTHRPYIGTIFGTNLLCMLLHLLFAPPAAGEATRGYLLGGLLIDFVGQASPVSKWRLLALDLLTLVLQILTMAVTLEKQVLQGKRLPSASIAALNEALDALGNQVRQQDHDAEERGVLSSGEPSTGEAIEMTVLGSTSQGRVGGEEDGERDELLGISDTEDQRDEHPLNNFYTGEYVVARLPILDTIRTQWRLRTISANAASAVTTGSAVRGASDLVGRRLTFSMGGRPLT